MIGKSLNERFKDDPFTGDHAMTLLAAVMVTHAKQVVEARERGPENIVVVMVDEKKAHAGRTLCHLLGFELKKKGTGVVGLAGTDLSKLVPAIPDLHRNWLEAPCAARETKVLLASRGLAFLSVTVVDGKSTTSLIGDVVR